MQSDGKFKLGHKPVTNAWIQTRLAAATASNKSHHLLSLPKHCSGKSFSGIASSSLGRIMAQAMLQYAMRRIATQTTKIKSAFLASLSSRGDNVSALEAKFYGTIGVNEPYSELVARQMIQYALGHARSQRSGDSYAQSLMVLEQGISNLRGGESTEDALGMLLLAMSTLLYERGELQVSIEKLQMVHSLANASLSLKVAAWEALVGLYLEAGRDNSSLVLANDCLQLLNSSSSNSSSEENASMAEILKPRAEAMKGLIHLILGELKSAATYFGGSNEDRTGNSALYHGEFSHATGNLSLAKDLYQKVIHSHETEDGSDKLCLASSNMISEEVLLGATCSLGQLLSHSGEFSEAEVLLTKALIKAESHFGSSHPKVGIILTCIALMYKQRAKLEDSSAILIQEGLYRRALDILKAPALDSQGSSANEIAKKDVIALARGGYAQVLCIQQKRRAEGEQMRQWAEASWRNRRMSLTEALEISGTSPAVVDTRICRVI